MYRPQRARCSMLLLATAATLLLALTTPGLAGRLPPEAVQVAGAAAPAAFRIKPESNSNPPDFNDGDDPTVRAHWALLVAGSSGWGNYRHQADVYHAYHVLLSGGYHPDRVIVMAYDDIANNTENPLPGRVFNSPDGPDVYAGVRIDYSGEDVTAETFLAVLAGDARAVAHKGSGRVLASGPDDRVFLFYSDHGAAGVLGMPSGPFLYADDLQRVLRRKARHGGFREMVLYIEACESGSMFEGLTDVELPIYMTTAANAVESSWATYCPEFSFSSALGQREEASGIHTVLVQGPPVAEAVRSGESSTHPGVIDTWVATLARAASAAAVAVQRMLPRLSAPINAWQQQQQQQPQQQQQQWQRRPPPPQLYTCLGDLYSVAWLEDAESGDLTRETLSKQYDAVRVRTSANFTYEQGSHVMRYGQLGMGSELAGDYEGMAHNGSSQARTTAAGAAGEHHLTLHSGLPSTLWRVLRRAARQPRGQMAGNSRSGHAGGAPSRLEQRNADLVPLAAAAAHAPCPHRRATARAALRAKLSARAALHKAAAGAATALLAGDAAHSSSSGGEPASLTASPAAQHQRVQAAAQHQRVQRDHGVHKLVTEPLPGRDGMPLVDDWGCLRGMVQAWEHECGALDQYGMRLTRLYANLCNAGVTPSQLAAVLRSPGGCASSADVQ